MISLISQKNLPWNEPWKENFLGIDFRQIDQNSQNLGKLEPQGFVFNKIDIYEVIFWNWKKFFTKDKWAVNAFEQEKWTIEKFREKTLKSSEAFVHNCSTNYLYCEFQKNSQKNVWALETCSITNYRSHHAICLL